MFWRVALMSKPIACAEAGIEAAFARSAKGIAKSKREETILKDGVRSHSKPRRKRLTRTNAEAEKKKERDVAIYDHLGALESTLAYSYNDVDEQEGQFSSSLKTYGGYQPIGAARPGEENACVDERANGMPPFLHERTERSNYSAYV
jgi:hypothetical protein